MGRKIKNFADERHLDEIIDWITSNCNDVLSDDLINYHDLLVRVHSIEVKYGQKRAISYAMNTEKLSGYRANAIVCECKELFLLDYNINKEIIKKWLILELDSLYKLTISTSKNSKDNEIAKNILLALRDTAEVNVPDPESIPDEFFKQMPTIFTLNPEHVGFDKLPTKELALLIDNLPDIPEKYKERAKMQSKIIDINLDDVIDGFREDTQNK